MANYYDAHIFINEEKELLYIHQAFNIAKNITETRRDVFPLKKITIPEILEKRSSKKPGLILKNENGLFYAGIPFELSAAALREVGKHSCSNYCSHLSALPDNLGGCAKVRDLNFTNSDRSNPRLKNALIDSKRIEKYDFIIEGVETFNTISDALVVIKCSNFIEMKKR